MSTSTHGCRRDPLVHDWSTPIALRERLLQSRPALAARIGGYDSLAMLWIVQPDGSRIVAARATFAGAVRWIVDAARLPVPLSDFASVDDIARAMLSLVDSATVSG